MAGIGFKLARIARDGGMGGVGLAGVHGAAVSAGPWLLAAGAVMALERWAKVHAGLAATGALQTVLIYAFSLSALVAAPTIAVTTRMLSDLLYAGRRAEVPGILAAALATVTVVALIAGAAVFAAAGMGGVDQMAASAIVVLLAQAWVANLFLTATRRHAAVLASYLGGIVAIAAVTALPGTVPAWSLPWLAVLGLAITVLLLVGAVRREFPAPPRWPDDWGAAHRRHALLAVAGMVACAAIWIDKWLSWYVADGSVAGLGWLRFHPVYDPASFLGLLSLVPGLTLLLITSETRFDQCFSTLMAACTGTAPITAIDHARGALLVTVLRDARLLVVVQATIAAVLWVFAPMLFTALGADPRGIFAFRFTVVGAVFHIAAMFCTIILSYLDLVGRVFILWTVFAITSAALTLATLHLGFAWLGWGYVAGAVMAATTGALLAGSALWDITYLLFVGNNPSIMGDRRRWA